jgi:sec-independent protein translocase protein TatA
MPIGPTELILVLAIVIIVFGVGKLPEVGGALGKGIREFRKATSDDEASAKPKEGGDKESNQA